MSPSELKRQHEQHNPNSLYFAPDTMQFFGDTMSNYQCKDGGNVWLLCRKRPVKHGLESDTKFSKDTFKRIL
jgi:hypothetical protein